MSKGLCYNFTVEPSKFVQILHDGYGHWLTISTVTVDAQEGEVYVFDSLCATSSFPTKCQVAALLQCQEASITLKYVDVPRRSLQGSCGVFTVAFATAPCFGVNPCELRV